MRTPRALVIFLVLASTLAATLAVTLAPATARAQFENHTWYFGEGLGLDFSTDPPTVLRDGRTSSYEGSASISDPNTGKLLFYTDGITVWNSSHQPMPNGFDLASHLSSTQPAVIVPDPGNASRYYIFTADQSGYAGTPRGINYSVVDMRRAGGMGDVVTKNTPLLAEASEKITAVKICNGSAYWVIAHEFFSNRFFAWKVDANGVDLPVVSDVGSIHGAGSGDGIGWMSASPDGSKLALAFFERSQMDGNVELFHFNAETGEITDPILLRRSLQPYGITFSPSGNKVYVTSVGHLDQFDVSNWDAASIYNTWEILTSVSKENGAIKLGPDGKLYAQHSSYLGVVSQPELRGFRCQYVENSLPMNSQIQWGLPNNIDAHSLVNCGPPEAHIKSFISPICEGTCTDFLDSSRFGATTWKWEFDGAQPAVSNLKNPTNICYPNEGTYKVQLTASNATGSSIAIKYIKVLKCLPPEVGLSDTIICSNNCISFIDTSTQDYTRTWEFPGGKPSTFSGKTPPPICYDKAGSYTARLIATNAHGSDTAVSTVTVEDCPWPVALAEYDTVVCMNTPVMFADRSANDPFSWEWSFEGGIPSSASTENAGPIVYEQPGIYTIRHIVINANGIDTAFTQIRVTRCDPPIATLEDLSICQDECIDLIDHSSNAPTSWRWTITGPVERTFDVKDPGKVCFTEPGTYQLQLHVANEYGESDALSNLIVTSSQGWAEPGIMIPRPISLCSSLDTFITLYSSCAPLDVANITSSHSTVAVQDIARRLEPNDTLRVPLRVTPLEVGNVSAVVSVMLGGQLLTIPVRYVANADAEQFTFGTFDNTFEALACEPALHEMSITNDACAEHMLASLAIEPQNSGFTLVLSDLNFVIPSKGTFVLGISYDASVAANAQAELVIRTVAGEERRINLTGDRLLPVSGSLSLSASGATALQPNELTSTKLSFDQAISEVLAPEVITLSFTYNSDLISSIDITAYDGWSVESKIEGRSGLLLHLRRNRAAIAEKAPLIDIAFKSFVAAQDATEIALDRVVCNPGDPDFERCVLDLEAHAMSSVAVLPFCGSDELRSRLADGDALRVTVSPHPVRSGASLTFVLHSGTEALVGQPLSVSLFDLQGKGTDLLSDVLRRVEQNFELPLADVSSGVYVLRVQVGEVITTVTLVVQ